MKEPRIKEMIIDDLIPLLNKDEIKKYLKVGFDNAYTTESLYDKLREKKNGTNENK